MCDPLSPMEPNEDYGDAPLLVPVSLKSQNQSIPSTTVRLFADDPSRHKALLHKLFWRLLPFLAALYAFSFLERTNIAAVHDTLKHDLHMSELEYGVASGLFFVLYILLEVPSNLILQRTDARVYLSSIIAAWGGISMLMACVQNFASLAVLRIALGAAEAGFFPGVIYYLTHWYTDHERTRCFSAVFIAQPLSGVLGALLSYGIINGLDGTLTLAAWRWIFLLEGAASVLLASVAFMCLPASPSTALWLSAEEREYLMSRQCTSGVQHVNDTATVPLIHGSTRQTQAYSLEGFHKPTASVAPSASPPPSVMSSPRTISACERARRYLHTLYDTTLGHRVLWLCVLMEYLSYTPVQGAVFYMPSMLSEAGFGDLSGTLLSAVPYSVAAICMVLNASFTLRATPRDPTQAYFGHVVIPLMLATVFAVLTSVAVYLQANVYWQLALITGATAGMFTAKPPLMAWYTSCMPGNLAAAVAMVACLSNTSGISTPIIMAALRSQYGSFAAGWSFLSACLAAAVLASVALNREIRVIRARAIRSTSIADSASA